MVKFHSTNINFSPHNQWNKSKIYSIVNIVSYLMNGSHLKYKYAVW